MRPKHGETGTQKACTRPFETHPKMQKLPDLVLEQIEKNEESRIIIFTQYRETAKTVTEKLQGHGKIDAVRFVGQATRSKKDKGLSQKKQAEVLNYFREGTYNVLVATSVAEEGLDIPSVDLVIFYEPVPSEIRTIQRRGRTGRKEAGNVIIMITEDTRDEAYYWSSVHKEKRMKEINGLTNKACPQTSGLLSAKTIKLPLAIKLSLNNSN